MFNENESHAKLNCYISNWTNPGNFLLTIIFYSANMTTVYTLFYEGSWRKI